VFVDFFNIGREW